jgi:hypothetical protein
VHPPNSTRSCLKQRGYLHLPRARDQGNGDTYTQRGVLIALFWTRQRHGSNVRRYRIPDSLLRAASVENNALEVSE